MKKKHILILYLRNNKTLFLFIGKWFLLYYAYSIKDILPMYFNQKFKPTKFTDIHASFTIPHANPYFTIMRINILLVCPSVGDGFVEPDTTIQGGPHES